MLDPRKEEQECLAPGLSSLEKALGQVGTTGAEARLPLSFFPPQLRVTRVAGDRFR